MALILVACGGSQQQTTNNENNQSTDTESDKETTENEKADIDFPKKPIEIIVPYAAGGGQDIAARTFAKYLEKEIGQRIIVSNVTGGGGVGGHTNIKDATPDGHTIGIIHTFTAVDQFTLEGIPYTEKDFIPIAMIAADPLVLVAKKDLGHTEFSSYYQEEFEFYKGVIEELGITPQGN